MLSRCTAKSPQRILQTLGQRDKALAAEHNMAAYSKPENASRKW